MNQRFGRMKNWHYEDGINQQICSDTMTKNWLAYMGDFLKLTRVITSKKWETESEREGKGQKGYKEQDKTKIK